MWLFKRQKTPTELLRENKRMLDRSIREIDRERASMMSQEKKLIAEIKRMAKANQMGAVKVRRSKATGIRLGCEEPTRVTSSSQTRLCLTTMRYFPQAFSTQWFNDSHIST